MIELNFPNPVLFPQDFFDREEERWVTHRLLDHALAPIPIILGERKMGKTSFVNVVKHEYASRAHAFILPHNYWVEHILQDVANSLYAVLYDPFALSAPRAPLPMPSHPDIMYIVELSERIAEEDARPVILIVDELDSLLRQSEPDERERILHFFLTLPQRTRGRVQLLFTMAQVESTVPPEDVTFFRERTMRIRLRPWEESETRAFLGWLFEGEDAVSEEAQALIFRAGGGHPYFTKALLHQALASRGGHPPRRLDTEDIRAAISRLRDLPEVRFTIQHLFEVHWTQEERQVLRWAALGHRVDGPVAARLEERGYLTRDNGNGYRLRIGILKHWLVREESWQF